MAKKRPTPTPKLAQALRNGALELKAGLEAAPKGTDPAVLTNAARRIRQYDEAAERLEALEAELAELRGAGA